MNCLNCKNCGPIALGSGHHRTCNAITSDLGEQLLLTQLSITDKETGKDAVVQNPHGVKNGWCIWPVNFDPVWIDECLFYNKKEEDGKVSK